MNFTSIRPFWGVTATADKLTLRVLVGSIVVSLVFLSLVTKTVLDARSTIFSSAEKDLHVHGQIMMLNVAEGLSLADYILKRARQEWQQNGQLRPHEEFIADFPNYRNLILQVAVIDEDGYLAASSLRAGLNTTFLGDRDHFKVHVEAKKDQVFISKPVVGRVSRQITLQFTRPILGSDGSFLGVIVVSLNPQYLAQKNFDVISGLDIKGVLIGHDGRFLGGFRGPVGGADTSEFGTVNTQHLGNEVINASVLTDDHIWSRFKLEDYHLEIAAGYPLIRLAEQTQYLYLSAFTVVLVILVAIAWYTSSILRLISSRNGLLIKLEESNVKASSASEMKSKFVSSISHELRTPLNGILGFAELVEMSSSLDEARRYGSVIHTSAEHLHQLVNTLLDLAKIEAGKMAVVRTRFKMRDLVDSVVSLHRVEAVRKGLEINISFDGNLPEEIETDRIKLMQVLNNLISNAIKFTESGAVFVIVKYIKATWEIIVVDTGIGMNTVQIEGVFDRFNNIKLENFSTSETQGAGLGMALCKELVELLDGRIDLQSEVNVGTTVRVTLQERVNETTN